MSFFTRCDECLCDQCPFLHFVICMINVWCDKKSSVMNVWCDECPVWSVMNVLFYTWRDQCPFLHTVWWMSGLMNVWCDECPVWWMSFFTRGVMTKRDPTMVCINTNCNDLYSTQNWIGRSKQNINWPKWEFYSVMSRTVLHSSDVLFSLSSKLFCLLKLTSENISLSV